MASPNPEPIWNAVLICKASDSQTLEAFPRVVSLTNPPARDFATGGTAETNAIDATL